jgi:hypothetical protein
MKKFLLILFFLFISFSYSHIKNKIEKIYLNSENSYITVINYSSWYAVDTSDFSGKYIFINPAEDEFGKPAGDGYEDALYINSIHENNNGGFGVFAYTFGEVEGWDNPMIDTLKNSRVECEGEMLISSSCSLVSDTYGGDFVILKYRTNNGLIKETKGILITKNDNKNYKYFYEKS